MKNKTKIFIPIGIVILFVLFYILNSSYRTQRVIKWFDSSFVVKNVPIRSSIITDDNVTLANSKKVYHLALLNGAFSEDEFSTIMDKLSTVIAVNKEQRTSRYFGKDIELEKELKYKVIAFGANEEHVKKIRTILDEIISKKKDVQSKKYYVFKLSGEKRIYPYDGMLTPFIGYNHKVLNKQNFTYLRGVQGIEKFYDTKLSSHKMTKDDKDDRWMVATPKYAETSENIVLNIDFMLQQKKEKELDEMKVNLSAEEVISVVLDTETFTIKAAASSNRYNPKRIEAKDFKNLNIHAIQYLFEIDDYILPINEAILKETNKTLKDGYVKFGLYEKSGVDLSHERVYDNHKLEYIDSGKKLKVNFMQLVKMYAVFYANGNIANPSIAKQNNSLPLKQIISKENALNIKKALPVFFEKMKDKKLLLEFEDYNKTAFINIEEIKYNGNNCLNAYFIVDTNEADEIFVDAPDDFPYLIVLSSSHSPSNMFHAYTLYSKKNKKQKIGEITQLINKYQANNRKGSEAIVEGIYKNKNGEYLIDRLTTQGTKMATCNACQKLNVETLKITNKGIFSISIRPFDIKTYKPLK